MQFVGAKYICMGRVGEGRGCILRLENGQGPMDPGIWGRGSARISKQKEKQES